MNYDEPYWDLIITNKSPKDYQTPKSLGGMMLEHHFSLKEFALLVKAENKSNTLT
ncbi:hypothetical protein [Legionella sp.]|uniref:hypothetical protein n=1 Tax=Legionella sp. TaxID=459 RepID=UPI003D0F56CB